MTGDSHDNDGYFEGYAMNRFVQAGRYKFYAHLYSDTNAVGTRVDLVYRTNSSSPFTSLYSPSYPSITKSIPIGTNAAPSFAEIETGRYWMCGTWPTGMSRRTASAAGAARPRRQAGTEQQRAPRIAWDHTRAAHDRTQEWSQEKPAGQRRLPPPARDPSSGLGRKTRAQPAGITAREVADLAAPA